MRPPSAQVTSLPRRLWIPAEALRSGHLREGLDALVKVYDEKNWLDRLLMADALLHTKGPSHAERVLKRAIDEPQLPSTLRAMAYGSLGTAFGYRNRFGEAVKSFERALHFAQKTDDIHLISEVQLGLLASKVDCFGPTAVGTLIAEALRSVQNAGDPQLLALLHFRVSVVEGRRGAIDVARRHIELGLSLLHKSPNPWIESSLHIAGSAVAFVRADLTEALSHSERAIQLARGCGGFFNELAALCNAGQVCIVLGRFNDAAKHLDEIEPSVREFPFLRFCLYDTTAQLQLATGDLAGCHDTLEALAHQLAENEGESASFPQLDSAMTRVKLLHKQGRLNDAVTLVQEASAAAHSRGERVLETALHILHAEILADQGRLDDASALANSAAERVSRSGADSLTTRAELERVRGKILHKLGASQHAIPVLERSVRIHESVGDPVARDAATAIMSHLDRHGAADNVHEDETLSSSITLIESMANLSTLGAHADLLAAEAYQVLLASGATERLALLAKTETTQIAVQQHNWPEIAAARGNALPAAPAAATAHASADAAPSATATPAAVAAAMPGERAGASISPAPSAAAAAAGVISLSFGRAKGAEFILLAKPKASFVASSGLSALDTLVRVAISREEHRRERIRQESVWPTEPSADQPGVLFVGRRMSDVAAQAMKVAKSPLTILLTGETGVGKEVLAREIHQLSLRAQQVFQPVVCAGMASGLLESQLFGHKKGSFTGAVADFPGVIRAAQGGTLFLDEIGELTTDLQIKLLRFLESKEIHPLGELHPLKVDVRVIAATNADLHQMVLDGKFREDLFYRLNVATFNIPPLRERREEIPSLVQHFLARYSQQNHRPMPRLSDEALEYLLLYRWPGNVRELKNEMERLAGMADTGSTIEPGDLKPAILAARKTVSSSAGEHEVTVRMNQKLHEAVDHLEREIITHVLDGHKDNLEAAARALGLSRKGLYHKRQRLGLL
jgi:DNA-binding NtrC family response regulator/tetratricopeptide (TPR) repeat protein